MFFVSELFGQCFVQAHAVEVLGRAAGAAAAGTGAGARTGAAAGAGTVAAAAETSAAEAAARLPPPKPPPPLLGGLGFVLVPTLPGRGLPSGPAGYHRWFTNTYRVPKPPA